ATLLIEDGKLASIISEQRTELIARHSLLSKHLGGSQVLSYPTSPHAWIRLPEPWTAASFVAAARRRGVSVLSGDVFAVDREKIPHAVRINIGAPRSCGKLEDALAILADILNSEDRFAVIGI